MKKPRKMQGFFQLITDFLESSIYSSHLFCLAGAPSSIALFLASDITIEAFLQFLSLTVIWC